MASGGNFYLVGSLLCLVNESGLSGLSGRSGLVGRSGFGGVDWVRGVVLLELGGDGEGLSDEAAYVCLSGRRYGDDDVPDGGGGYSWGGVGDENVLVAYQEVFHGEVGGGSRGFGG